MTTFTEIDSTTLKTLLSNERQTLVDVRSADEVTRGMIHGAVHIPLHLLPQHVLDFESENSLIFYCHSGVRSAQACSYMAQQGWGNLFNLRGGVLEWGAAGFVLEPKQ